MKKIFTIFSAALISLSAFAATEAAWYNDVTSISAGGQYYIYSVKGAGFVQAGQSKVKAINPNNYNSETGLLFTINGTEGATTTSGSYFLSSYQAGTCGPVATSADDGTKLYWTAMASGKYWNIHGYYKFSVFLYYYSALSYSGSKYEGSCNLLGNKETHEDEPYQWYLISSGQYDRHFAIYFYELYKESIADYSNWENLVPANYYAAMQNAYNTTFDVTNAEHSAEVVKAHRAALKAYYENASDVATAYSQAKAAIKALEDVTDKGDGDLTTINTDIANAKTAIEQALSVDALNAAVAAPALKAIDPVTINVTTFDALTSVTNAASSANGRTITYAAEDNTVINAEGMAIHKGTTNLIATAAATDDYYEFVRKAEVTVNAINNEGNYNATVCAGEPVVFQSETFTETTTKDFKLENTTGGDSIVHFSLIVYPTDTTELNDTLKVGESLEVTEDGWTLNDQPIPADSYVQNAEAAFDLIRTVTNIYGCDSVIVLHVVVEAAPTNPTGMSNITTGERAHKEFHNGVLYIRRGESLYTITGAKAE